jgi:vacuolar protein sorting-associated protein 11
MKYARVLLGHCPKETTQLFIDYYTGQYRPKKEIVSSVQPQAPPGSAVHNLASFLPLSYMNVGTGTKSQPSEAQIATQDESFGELPTYDIPKPRAAFSSFVDHPSEFITFLEALISRGDAKEEDKIDLYTTLFEMYLDAANKRRDAVEKQQWEEKAKMLISGRDVGSFFLSWLFLIRLTVADSCLDLKCSAAFGFVQLPRGDNTRPRTGRPSI